MKIIAIELAEDLTPSGPLTYLLSNLSKSLAYMSEMFQYQGYLSKLHQGEIFKINIKETFYSDNIDYSMTIVDSDDKDLIAQNNCASILVTKSYSNDFVYITREGNMQLCKQVKSSRLMMIRPNMFNNDSVNEIKEKNKLVYSSV